MGTKREKKPVMKPASMEEVEQLFATYADADAKIVEINAKIDQKMTEIREKYADELRELSDKREDCFNAIQVFAESREDLFTGKKSIDLSHGTIGFRTGTPKLKLRKGFQWGSALELLKKFLPSYVRTAEEPAKDKLLADRDQPEVNEHLKTCGIEVVQDETFYINLKKEEVPA